MILSIHIVMVKRLFFSFFFFFFLKTEETFKTFLKKIEIVIKTTKLAGISNIFC